MRHDMGIQGFRNSLLNCAVIENYAADVRGKVVDTWIGIASEHGMQ